MKSKLTLFALCFGLGTIANAQSLEFVCSARCVSVDTYSHRFSVGTQVTGWSEYSSSEAFIDMASQCSSGQLVQSFAAMSSFEHNVDIQTSRHQTATHSASDYQRVSIDKIKRHKIKDVNIIEATTHTSRVDSDNSQHIRIHTEDQFWFDLEFASPNTSCRSGAVQPDTGRRYIGNQPIGG